MTTNVAAIHLQGRARVFGDDINTDYIVTSSRKRETLDHGVLKRYLLETIAPDFAATVQPGDILVGGRNFGCGSAMEVAVTVPLAAGIGAVIARSFARTYFRNAINNGLLPIECNDHAIAEGDLLDISVADTTVVRNLTRQSVIQAAAIPPFLREILRRGGLVQYLQVYGRFAS